VPAKRLLVIEPHSDDGAIAAGGFLLKHREDFQLNFLLAVASDVSLVHTGTVPRNARVSEFEHYCSFLGARWVRPTTPRNQMPLDKDGLLDVFERRELVALIEEGIELVRPHTLIVTGPSFHHDHTAVFEATMAALRPTAGYFPSEVLISENPTYVYATPFASSFQPNTYCQLSEAQLEAKLAMFQECFPSQIRESSNALSPEGIRKWAAYRGIEARSPYAEAFQTLHRAL